MYLIIQRTPMIWAQMEAGQQPTTVIACLIAVVMGLMGLNGFVVKWLLSQVEASHKLVEVLQDKHSSTVERLITAFEKEAVEIREQWGRRLETDRTVWTDSIKAIRDEYEKDRQHTARDREQWAMLADAERQRRMLEQRNLFDRLDIFLKKTGVAQ